MPLDDRGLYAPADFTAKRSRAFQIPCVQTGMRATRANLRVPKADKHGRRYEGRDELLLGDGFHSVQEAERLLLDLAAENGLNHTAVELEGRPWLETEINAG